MRRALRRAVILVADGVGCGGAPDAAAYGDEGADTLGHLAQAMGGLSLPTLASWGLGRLTPILGVSADVAPVAAHGAMCEASAGKDTITGHWEMAGLVTRTALATFPRGFPEAIVGALEAASGRKVLGNEVASGTAIIEELGPQHLATGGLIVYTSADSVLQIAAHEEVVPIPELYAICEKARVIADENQIGRVIARPFVGRPGAFRRTYNRKDWALVPPEPTLCDHLTAHGWPVVGVGKISDIFAGRGISRSLHSEGNADGLRLTLDAWDALERGLLFVNLVDFDMLYGHRNDVPGFARALGELDAWLPSLASRLGDDDAVFITADHGNDPLKTGTDHTRERVPLLVFGPGIAPVPLGDRTSFCDLGQTIVDGLGLPPLAQGVSFFEELR